MILNWQQGILNVCQDKLKKQKQVAVDERGDYDAVLYTGTENLVTVDPCKGSLTQPNLYYFVLAKLSSHFSSLKINKINLLNSRPFFRICSRVGNPWHNLKPKLRFMWVLCRILKPSGLYHKMHKKIFSIMAFKPT